jgi:hypothetical protein
MSYLQDTTFYEGGPTSGPETLNEVLDQDGWFESAQMGRADLDPNNDLRGVQDGLEVEQP